MVNIADKIFNFLRKRFVKTNGRFPTPKEADDMISDAQKIVNDAVQNNMERYGDQADPQEIISKTLSQDPQKIVDDATPEMRAPRPKATIEAMPFDDPKLREASMKKKLEALNEQARGSLKTADEVTTGPAARSKVQKDKEGLESMMDQIPVRDDSPQIGEVIDQSQRSRMPMRLIEDFGTELSKDQLMREGYTPTQADILMRARKKLLEGEEMNPNEALLRVKEEMANDMGVDVDDVDIDFEIEMPERDDFAKGGVIGGKKEEEEELEDDDPGMFDDLFDRMFGEYELEKLRKSGRKPNAEGGIMDTREGYQFGGPALKYIREAFKKARQRSGVSGTGEPMLKRFSADIKEKAGSDLIETPRGQYSIKEADKIRKQATVDLLLDELKLIENIEKQAGMTGIPSDTLEEFGKKMLSSDREVASNAFFDFVKTMSDYGVGTPGKMLDDMIRTEKGMTIEGIEQARGALELYRRNLQERRLNAEGGLNYLMGF